MKKLILFFLICPSLLIAAETNGFKDFIWGTPCKDILQKTNEVENFTWGIINGESDTCDENYLKATGYMIGDRYFDVYLFFDNENKFYYFSITGDSLNADYLDPNIYDDALFLSKVFKEKYGQAIKCLKPSILAIKRSYVSYFCKWNNKDLDIYTGISTRDFQYYAVAVVTNKQMEKRFEKYKKDEEAKQIKKGKKAF